MNAVRFALFVDGSNLYGALRPMQATIHDYAAFFRQVYLRGVAAYRDAALMTPPVPAALQRVWWYVVGSMDRVDLDNPDYVARLRTRFFEERDLSLPFAPNGADGDALEQAWFPFFRDVRSWYDSRRAALESMRRFYHAVRGSTQMIEIVECGHWRIDIARRIVTEKQLDTTLAVDMLAFESSYDVALLVGGDADTIPSVNYMKERGKTVGAVEILATAASERSRSFSGHLRSAADFVVRVDEHELIAVGAARAEAPRAEAARTEPPRMESRAEPVAPPSVELPT